MSKLPSKHLLCRKGILNDNNIFCDICSSNIKDIKHIFINCHFAKDCWQLLKSAYGWIYQFNSLFDLEYILSYPQGNNDLKCTIIFYLNSLKFISAII